VCTIVILHHVVADLPLVVAANRDEFYARTASGPQVLHPRSGARPLAIGGVDGALGGSWMGATEAGLFVGLTNQRTFRPANRELRSRGEVVTRALQHRSVAAVHDYLAGLDGRQFNPFNLLYGDGRALELCRAHPGAAALTFEPVPDGIHVLPNDGLDSPRFPKVERARDLLGTPSTLATLPWPELQERLTAVLADHHRPPADGVDEPPPDSILTREWLVQLQALCIHTEVYGTCSATIAAIAPGRVVHYAFAPGPPCQTSFEDVTALLSG